jgi:Heterokaryon incompatibility protein (HET)
MTSLATLHQTLPVDEDTVRLLILQPAARKNADIKCALVNVRLSDSPVTSYEAVSYTWGTPSTNRRIHIEDQQVHIRDNLYRCLRRLRFPHSVRVLWIDAICINQTDLDEKGHQIRLMPKIFKTAEKVLVWVGEAADGSHQLMHYANRLTVVPSSFAQTPRSIIDAKVKFFRRPYWSRTWVVQELFMAKQLVIYCGRSEIEEDQFRKLLQELSAMGPLDGYDKQVILLATQRDADGYTFRQSLDELLAVYWRTECFDSRDKVYALLGLVRNDDPARSLEVDYTITTQQLHDHLLGKGFVKAETLKLAFRTPWSEILAEQYHNNPVAKRSRGYAPVESEGRIVETTKGRTTSNEVSSHTFFCTKHPSETWLTECDIEPDDICYSFPGRKCSVIFRQRDVLRCVGSACVTCSGGQSFTPYLKDLQTCLIKKSLFDMGDLVVLEQQDDSKPRYYAGASPLLLSAVESYTSLHKTSDTSTSLNLDQSWINLWLKDQKKTAL